MSAEILREALYAARIGLGYVYPQSRYKVPLFKGPNCIRHGCTQVHDGPRDKRHVHATADEAVIRQWAEDGHLRSGFGIIPAPGMIVLDCDAPKAPGEDDGRKTFARLNLPATASVVSGSGKGRHFWYRLPEDIELRGCARILPGIDLVAWDWKRGRGSPWQACGVGSMHPSGPGNRYAWEDHPEDVDIATLPQKFANELIWRLQPEGRTYGQEAAPRARVVHLRTQRTTVRSAVTAPVVNTGTRNASLLTIACDAAENMATDAEIRAAVAQAIEDRVVSPDGQYRGRHADKQVRDVLAHARNKYPLTTARRTIRKLRDAVIASREFKGTAGATDRPMMLAILRHYYKAGRLTLNVPVRTAALLQGDAGLASVNTAEAALKRLRGDIGRNGRPHYQTPWLERTKGSATHAAGYSYRENDEQRIEIAQADGSSRRPCGIRYKLNDEKVIEVGTVLQQPGGRLQAVRLSQVDALFTRHAAAQRRVLGPNGAHVLAVMLARPSWRNCNEIAAAANRTVPVVRRAVWAIRHLFCCGGRQRHEVVGGKRTRVPCVMERGREADGLIERTGQRLAIVADAAEILQGLDAVAARAKASAERRRNRIASQRADQDKLYRAAAAAGMRVRTASKLHKRNPTEPLIEVHDDRGNLLPILPRRCGPPLWPLLVPEAGPLLALLVAAQRAAAPPTLARAA